MPIPIIGAAAAAGASVGIGLGSGVVGSFLGAWLEPDVLATRYAAYFKRPIVLPPPDAIWDAVTRGHLTPDEGDKLLKVLGVETHRMSDKGKVKARKIAWLSAFEGRRPRLNPAELIRLRQRGHFASEDEFKRLWGWTLAEAKDWAPLSRSELWNLTPDLYLRAWMRENLSDTEVDKALRAIGVVSSGDQAIAKELTKQIPGISDLVSMMVRDTFDKDAVDKRGLGLGFPAELKAFGKALGFDWNIGIDTMIDGKPVPLTWLLAYWIAHWQPISPTLARELEIRLRPTGGPNNTPRDPSGLKWERADTLRALKIADYPPGEIDKIAALNYVKPGLRQIREMHYLGVVKEENNDKGKGELSEMYEDLGYHAQQAPDLAETTIRYNVRRRGREVLNVTRQKIGQAYQLGILTDQETLDLLKQIGLSDSEAKLAFMSMALETKMLVTRKSVAGIRKNYLLGDYTATAAVNAMEALGVRASQIAANLMLWDQEQRQWRLERAPAILTRWLILGTIDVPEIRRRLGTIGYPAEEIDRIIASAIFAQRRQAPPGTMTPRGKGGRGGIAKAKELSDAAIKEGLADKLLTPAEAVDKLMGQGYDAEDANFLVKLWSTP